MPVCRRLLPARFFLTILPCLLFCLAPVLLPGAESDTAGKTGAVLSVTVWTVLQDAGLNPEKQYLSEIQSEDFPYNVVVTFLPFMAAPENDSFWSRQQEQAENLTLLISQEDCLSHIDGWLGFLANMQTQSLRVKTQVVFTANDRSLLPAAYRRGIPAGARKYMESLEDPACILVLNPGDSRQGGPGPFVLPGSRSIAPVQIPFLTPFRSGISAPRWLVEQLPFPVFGETLSLYRLNLTAYEERLTLFRANEIPAAVLVWNPASPGETEALFSGLRQFVLAFAPGAAKDFNYGHIPSGMGELVITESAFIRWYAAAAALGLLYLCFFSFFGSRRKHHVTLRKVWFYLPGIIGATWLALFLMQNLLEPVFPANSGSLLPLAAKAIGVFILFSVLNGGMQFVFNIPPAAYGALLALQSVLNMLVFGLFDPEALLLVFLEFALTALLLRAMSRNTGAVAAAVILGLCYLLPGQALLRNADPSQAAALVSGGIWQNLLPACLLLPFLLLWFRIQGQFIIFLRQKGCKKRTTALLNGALALFLAGSFLGGSLWLSHQFSFQQTAQAASATQALIIDQSSQGVSLQTRITPYLDQEIVEITVRTDMPVIRCDIEVGPAGGAGITPGSPFRMAGETGAVEFLLPEYPPNLLRLAYTAGRLQQTRIRGTFFVHGGNGTIIRKEAEVILHQ